jgi:hypothetical protein
MKIREGLNKNVNTFGEILDQKIKTPQTDPNVLNPERNH